MHSCFNSGETCQQLGIDGFLTLQRNHQCVEEENKKTEVHGQKERKKEEHKWTDRTKKQRRKNGKQKLTPREKGRKIETRTP